MPAVGARKPSSVSTSVVLPAPLGPSRVDDLAVGDVEGDVVERAQGAEVDLELLDLEGVTHAYRN